MSIRNVSASFALLALVTLRTASASTMSLCGPSICFQYDNSQAGIGYFGAPTLVGDAVRFLPPVLLASVMNGGSAATSTSFLFDRIYSTTGGDLAAVTVNESGDYIVAGTGSVSASLGLTARDNQYDGIGVPGAFPETTSGLATFSDSQTTSGFQLWGLSATVNPAGAFTDFAGDISLRIAADLSAIAAGFGDFSFIQQKFVVSATTVTPVPEPATPALLGLALVAVLGSRSRPGNAPGNV